MTFTTVECKVMYLKFLNFVKNTSGIVILFVCSMQASAQEPPRMLDIEELFRLGIEHSPQVQGSLVNKEIADEQEKTARTNRLPDINVGVVGGYVGQPLVFEKGLTDASRPYMPDWKQNYSVDVSQPIYTGGKLKRYVEKAALATQIAELGVDRDVAEVKLLLIGSYANLFAFYKQTEALNKNIEMAQQRLHDIRQMKAEGMVTENEVIRIELLLSGYQLSLREVNDNIAIVSKQLDIALGLDENLLLQPDTAELTAGFPLLAYDDYVQQAYEQYPELKMAKTGIAMAEKDVSLAKSDYLPSLSFRVGNTLQRPITSVSPPEDLYMNTWNASLVLSYNLSSLYRNRHQVKASEREVDFQRLQQEQQMQDIRNNVKAALVKHREASDRVQVLTLSVKQATENYRIVNNKYSKQLAILTDLLDASSVLLDAELQLTAAKANVVYTYYQLLRSSGNL